MRALIAEQPASRIPALARSGSRRETPAPSSYTRELQQRSISEPAQASGAGSPPPPLFVAALPAGKCSLALLQRSACWQRLPLLAAKPAFETPTSPRGCRVGGEAETGGALSDWEMSAA